MNPVIPVLRAIDGWAIVLNDSGEVAAIPPAGADPADCPSSVVVAMCDEVERRKVTNAKG